MAADEDSANLGRVYSDAEIRAQEARWRLLQGTLFRSAATDDDASVCSHDYGTDGDDQPAYRGSDGIAKGAKPSNSMKMISKRWLKKIVTYISEFY